MTILKVSSQSIKKDSVTIHKKTFISIMKESRKCDSLRVAFENKSVLIEDIIKSNNQMYIDFQNERDLKNQALKRKIDAENELKKLDKKIFSIGFHFGSTVDKDWNPVPVISVGLNIHLFSFNL
jgi:allophanate hydrolase subunit 1